MDFNTNIWTKFYSEFATKLLSYKNNRKELIKYLFEIYEEIGLKFPKLEADDSVIDIDPFTIFGFFNKGISKENRVLILQAIAKKFLIKSEIPKTFDGIPLVNNQRASFFCYNGERKDGDIDNLWNIFEAAIKYEENSNFDNKRKLIEHYDKVIMQKGIRWNITMGLYWIRSYCYINLDQKNRIFIKSEHLLDENFLNEINSLVNPPTGEQYLNLCEKIKKIIQNNENYSTFPELSSCAWTYQSNKDLVDTPIESNEIENRGMYLTKHDMSKNIILYGPPGTGKTYTTVIYAVAIIENKNTEEIKKEDYSAVLERYKKYKSEELIDFTTFHQSYTYEDFIEGIKPVVTTDDEKNDVQYEICPGLFKKFCEKASRNLEDYSINDSPNIWKVSLAGTYDNPTRKDCMENNHIRIGFDGNGKNITSESSFEYGGKSVLNAFIYKMKIGDIILSCYTSSTIDAIGVVTGDYEWDDNYDHYKRLRKVKWLVKGIRENILKINNNTSLTLSTVYKLNNISLNDVMDIVEKYSKAKKIPSPKKNHVFIIDEINRGNISKIFGELITLIEDTKRIGNSEEVKVRLPYSKQKFGVPNNVYIIGTMNTADRSIATIDTALRRRFRFKEMLPDASVLDGIKVEGISIKNMLDRLNRRITILYDREHTLGHAYFLPLKTEPTLEKLGEIFENSIIPLLQEYFYDDYEKIRLILGDGNKENEDEQFIKATLNTANDYVELFGNVDYTFDESYTYEINPNAFYNINAYKFI